MTYHTGQLEAKGFSGLIFSAQDRVVVVEFVE